MHLRGFLSCIVVLSFAVAALANLCATQAPPAQPEAYFTWSAAQAEAAILAMTAKGRVPGTRKVLNTEQARGYKLRAVWVTPDVLRASARRIQLRERLNQEQTRALVAEAEAAGVLIVLVELDPDEGPGVVPPDWGAFLQPGGAALDSGAAAKGIENRRFEDVRALHHVLPRNYDYERYWMLFAPETDSGKPLFSNSDREAELIVHIRGREDKVRWPIPDSIRQRLAARSPAK